MEQLVLLLIIGAISLINWLLQRSAELREKKKAERAAMDGRTVEPPRTGPPPVAADPSESMRKLMEALGLPMESAPPPPVSMPPPIPEVPEELQPAPFEKETEAAPRAPWGEPVVVPTFSHFPVPITPPMTLSEESPVFSPLPSVHRRPVTRFRELLATPGGVRDAIVLAEVLGRPVGSRR